MTLSVDVIKQAGPRLEVQATRVPIVAWPG